MKKYSLEERLLIGKRIYEGDIGKKEAAGMYGIGVHTARSYLREYRKTNGLPISTEKSSRLEMDSIPQIQKDTRVACAVNIGDRFGHVTVLSDEGIDEKHYHRYLVECDCGRRVSMLKGNLFLNRENLRCRSCATSWANEKRRVKLCGKSINGWRVLQELPYRNNLHWYECECIRCGNRAIRSAGQITFKKSARCENCKSQFNFVINGDVAEGTLPNGTRFLIDVEDVERVNQYRWHVGKEGYPIAEIDGHMVKLHRFVIGETNPKVMIDHANRNVFDARKSNLRRADTTQNSANHGLFATNQTGYTGVYFSNSSHRYEVKVGYRKRRILLGSSKDNIVRLAQMYNIAASFFFGEFAGALNDVPQPDDALITAIIDKCRRYKELLDGSPEAAVA